MNSVNLSNDGNKRRSKRGDRYSMMYKDSGMVGEGDDQGKGAFGEEGRDLWTELVIDLMGRYEGLRRNNKCFVRNIKIHSMASDQELFLKTIRTL